jgi:hypothetical protein
MEAVEPNACGAAIREWKGNDTRRVDCALECRTAVMKGPLSLRVIKGKSHANLSVRSLSLADPGLSGAYFQSLLGKLEAQGIVLAGNRTRQ